MNTCLRLKHFPQLFLRKGTQKVPPGSRVIRRNLNGFVDISSLRRRATKCFAPHGLQEAERDIQGKKSLEPTEGDMNDPTIGLKPHQRGVFRL